jgi:hypothetical protein
MLRRRPTRVGGALTPPNWRRLLLMLMMERLLHSAALAICEALSDLLNIIVSIISSFERGSLGAMMRREIWMLKESFDRERWETADGVRVATLSAHPCLPLLSEQVKCPETKERSERGYKPCPETRNEVEGFTTLRDLSAELRCAPTTKPFADPYDSRH